mmetsp:Transcript_2412/g.5749  ORF Transcript_2412/g.5749 Transcript_2412/m.5749 type:complete len:295 (-) Transcript_2412:702-1586(-)
MGGFHSKQDAPREASVHGDCTGATSPTTPKLGGAAEGVHGEWGHENPASPASPHTVAWGSGQGANETDDESIASGANTREASLTKPGPTLAPDASGDARGVARSKPVAGGTARSYTWDEGTGASGGPGGGQARLRFQAAVRVVVQENEVKRRQSATSSEKMLAVMRLATQQAKLKGTSSRHRFVEATRQAASAAISTLTSGEPEKGLSPEERGRLKNEFQAVDKENKGTLTMQQLEKLLTKRAYYTRKEAWKEEQRRKNKGKGTWNQGHTSTHAAHFKYSGADNKKDRTVRPPS